MKPTTQLYPSEGRENLETTLDNVVIATKSFDVDTVVVFVASAESVLRLRELLDDSRKIIAVTFPVGFTALVDGVAQYVGVNSPEEQRRLESAGIAFVRGVMPFWTTGDSETNRVLRKSLGVFGGGLQLCVQALLMACDAGEISAGERSIAMVADTAILAHTENAFRFFADNSRFAVEHIICKPIAYSISRPSVTDRSRIVKSVSTTPRDAPSAEPEIDS